MSNYNILKTNIAAQIKQNGTKAITGQILQTHLLSMITSLGAGYQYMGVAALNTNPGTPDYKCFYIATAVGTYSNFGSPALTVAQGEVAIFYYDTAWHKAVTGAASKADVDALIQTLEGEVSALGQKVDENSLDIRNKLQIQKSISNQYNVPATSINLFALNTYTFVVGNSTADSVILRLMSNGTEIYNSGIMSGFPVVKTFTPKKDYENVVLTLGTSGTSTISVDISTDGPQRDSDKRFAELVNSTRTKVILAIGQDGKYVKNNGVVTSTSTTYAISQQIQVTKGQFVEILEDCGPNVAVIAKYANNVYTPVVVASASDIGRFLWLVDEDCTIVVSGKFGSTSTFVPEMYVYDVNFVWKDIYASEKAVMQQEITDIADATRPLLVIDLGNALYNIPSNTIAKGQITNGNLSVSTVNARSVIYFPVVQGQRVRVTGNNATPAERPISWGVYSSVPADGSTTPYFGSFDTAVVDGIISCEIAGYLAIGTHATYHTNIVYHLIGNMYDLATSKMETAKSIYASQYDGQFLDVAYSVISPLPGNTEVHFQSMIDAGFNGLKADMCLTSDNKIVLCHDAGYTFDGNGRITTYDSGNNTPIHTLTLAQIEALEFATQVDGQYVHPCTLDRFLYLCKIYGVVPYITFREEYEDDTIAEMYRLLKKYKLEHKAIINLFRATESQCAKLNYIDNFLICNTHYVGDTFNTDTIDNTEALGCKYICLYYADFDPVADATLVQYAATKDIRIWLYGTLTQAQADSFLQGGITGFQQYNPAIVPPLPGRLQ